MKVVVKKSMCVMREGHLCKLCQTLCVTVGNLATGPNAFKAIFVFTFQNALYIFQKQ